MFTLAECSPEQFILASPASANFFEVPTQLNWISANDRNSSFLDSKLGKRITLRGTAQNAVLGAIVMVQNSTPVYIHGLPEWDDALVGKTVVVAGTLGRKTLAPAATISPNGEVSHGGSGTKNYILEKATWRVAPRR
ncbi:MAG: hypothetical protein SFW36_22735 [Leptolyngbyaceae cyanobacterium bins.59]|nr:hypothetical protein [Leptolyngbyaceae cyanobacterium bins.59]